MANDKQSLLRNWIHVARDKNMWNYKIEKLKRPGIDIPEPQSSQGHRNSDHNHPPPSITTPRQRRQRNGTAAPLREAFEVLGLEPNATEREVRIRFRQLSRKYHPDKHQQCETGMLNEEATEYFQKANNAQEVLIENLRSNVPQ